MQQSSADVFQNKCYKKVYYVHKKRPVSESLFKKDASLKACNFSKKRLQHRCVPENIASVVVLVSLLLTFNIFPILF